MNRKTFITLLIVLVLVIGVIQAEADPLPPLEARIINLIPVDPGNAVLVPPTGTSFGVNSRVEFGTPFPNPAVIITGNPTDNTLSAIQWIGTQMSPPNVTGINAELVVGAISFRNGVLIGGTELQGFELVINQFTVAPVGTVCSSSCNFLGTIENTSNTPNNPDFLTLRSPGTPPASAEISETVMECCAVNMTDDALYSATFPILGTITATEIVLPNVFNALISTDIESPNPATITELTLTDLRFGDPVLANPNTLQPLQPFQPLQSTQPIPEPGTAFLFTSGLVGLIMWLWKKEQQY